MLVFYQNCFWFGCLWIIITALLGEVLDGIGDSNLEGFSFISGLSPKLISIFLLIGGLMGWQLSEQTTWSNEWILLVALISGVLVCCLFEFCIFRVIKKAQSTSCVSREELIGETATVTLRILPNRLGKITLIHKEDRHDFTAQSNLDSFQVGDLVQIVEFNGPIACVEAIKTKQEEGEN